MNAASLSEFPVRILEWARKMFADEVQSDFSRAKIFDGLWARARLDAVRQQSQENILILARVLPLQVLGETPDRRERLGKLSEKEIFAVQKLKVDFDRNHSLHYRDFLNLVGRANNPDIKREFAEACKIGKRMHREVGVQWNCETVKAGPGEMGLVCRRSWGRIVVSLNLGRSMTAGYSISLYGIDHSRIRYQDSYLDVLGIGQSDFDVPTAEEYREKFSTMIDFAFWHVQQYDLIANEILTP